MASWRLTAECWDWHGTGVGVSQDENAVLASEKQELIAAQAEKEVKMSKLTDLVITAGANMSMEEAAAAQARKLKATSRQSWCPGAMSLNMGGGFGSFPSKAPGHKLVLSSAIDEEDELGEGECDKEQVKRKSSDSAMSLCSAADEDAAEMAAQMAQVRQENAELLGQVEALQGAVKEKQAMLQQAAEGGEAALTELAEQVQLLKTHKAALENEV